MPSLSRPTKRCAGILSSEKSRRHARQRSCRRPLEAGWWLECLLTCFASYRRRRSVPAVSLWAMPMKRCCRAVAPLTTHTFNAYSKFSQPPGPGPCYPYPCYAKRAKYSEAPEALPWFAINWCDYAVSRYEAQQVQKMSKPVFFTRRLSTTLLPRRRRRFKPRTVHSWPELRCLRHPP